MLRSRSPRDSASSFASPAAGIAKLAVKTVLPLHRVEIAFEALNQQLGLIHLPHLAPFETRRTYRRCF